jgi:multiple sugar transport system permease protein
LRRLTSWGLRDGPCHLLINIANNIVLLFPFLAIYGLFLVYPFFKGIWISLHDWNLLAVAFNPDAKEFIGAENYVRSCGGGTSNGGLFASPVMQTVGVLGIGLAFLGYRQGRLSGRRRWRSGIAGALFFCCRGFIPERTGGGMTAAFWPTVGNTILFVGLAVPGVTITALIWPPRSTGRRGPRRCCARSSSSARCCR